MHEEYQDPLKGAKHMEPPQKSQIFPGLLAIFSVWPEMGQPKSGQTKFDLKCCSNKSGQTKFGLKCCSNKSGTSLKNIY